MIIRVVTSTADIISSFSLNKSELASIGTVDDLKNFIRKRTNTQKTFKTLKLPTTNKLLLLSLPSIRYKFEGWVYPNPPHGAGGSLAPSDWEKTFTLKALGVLDVPENIVCIVVVKKPPQYTSNTDLVFTCHAKCTRRGTKMERIGDINSFSSEDIREVYKTKRAPNYVDYRYFSTWSLLVSTKLCLSTIRLIVDFASPENICLSDTEWIESLKEKGMHSIQCDCRGCNSNFQIWFHPNHRVIDIKLAVARSHYRLTKNNTNIENDECKDIDDDRDNDVACDYLGPLLRSHFKFYRNQYIREIWSNHYDMSFWACEILKETSDDGSFSLLDGCDSITGTRL